MTTGTCVWHDAEIGRNMRIALVLACGPCRFCKAEKGEHCHARAGKTIYDSPHKVRWDRARKILCTCKK